ncbi:Protein SKG3 [Cladobotryum mycophilum]|uniref:Protein SKG3 n=1 Tax=Cladobotryum mycophilum TaxID=491253 RepID=A0ABR0SFP2_9HYPO
MSQFSAGHKTPSPPPASDTPPSDSPYSNIKPATLENRQPDLRRPVTPPSNSDYGTPMNSPPRNSPPHQRQRSNSRPMSIVQTYQPSIMDINEDTIPELLPIFTFLNSQSNRLYHEGYFLKLDDQNTQGKPNPDRTWTECFAQLVGTVLSLWDAAELDAAGEDGEVLPKFINLTDASIKMIESLPTRSNDEQPLQNILSISTAGRNRYLLHFNSHDSLLEWTAAIRLAMFEHSALQEAYTGALIAGKGKSLNNINIIMERSRFKTEVWARVRFGAGVPWRRCWCVITPPDEKEYAKLQKELKKRSAYDRSPVPVLKGDIKFYDAKIEGKKQKKALPIASISDAYSAYAIYPQAKSLVDASTLIKIEGDIAIHTEPPSSSEGFVFIMPETRPAISGFETMMQFLFPTWDTFGLYGRPGRLIASILDSRSLMFAMPKHKQYGYLELQDIIGLLQADGGAKERDWRKRLKEATRTRMNSRDEGVRTRSHSRSASRTSNRLSFAGMNVLAKQRVGFTGESEGPHSRHLRHSSESGSPERLYSSSPNGIQTHLNIVNRERGASVSSDDGRNSTPSPVEAMRPSHTPEPVSRPPAFSHNSQDRPSSKPYHSPELRRMNSRLSSNTLVQMAKASGVKEPSGLGLYSSTADDTLNGPAVPPHTSPVRPYFNENHSREAFGPPDQNRGYGDRPPSSHSANRPPSTHSANRPLSTHSQYRPPSTHSAQRSRSPYEPGQNDQRPLSSEGRRSPYPPGANGGPQIQVPPSPRPLPNIPPSQDRSGPGAGSQGSPLRKPLPTRFSEETKHKSITPNDIIEHYTSQSREQYDRDTAEALSHLPPPPPPHQQYKQRSEPPKRDVERPRAGVLKTIGGADDSMSNADFHIPDVDFGPTINYGAPSIFNKQHSASRADAGPRPRTSHERQGSQVKATMAWQPASPPTPQRSQGLSPEQYVQQRAAVASTPHGHGRQLSTHSMASARGRSPSPSVHSGRSVSPRPSYPVSHMQSQPNIRLQY